MFTLLCFRDRMNLKAPIYFSTGLTEKVRNKFILVLSLCYMYVDVHCSIKIVETQKDTEPVKFLFLCNTVITLQSVAVSFVRKSAKLLGYIID